MTRLPPYIETAWVEGAHEISGLDHLGVKGPCINIYGQLLPGITNVTDRARYFSFYTWVIWKLDQLDRRKKEEIRDNIRKADCLLTLIYQRHAIKSSEDETIHAGSATGSNTFSKIIKNANEKDKIKLSDYADLNNYKERYFKNPYGGLGQYYIGSLRDLYILKGDLSSGSIRYTKERGEQLAKAFDKSVNGELFWSYIDKDVVSVKSLDNLSSFCLCHLKDSSDEKELLTSILFAKDDYVQDKGKIRQPTLMLYLDLVAQLQNQERLDVNLFRNVIYGQSFPDKSEWNISDNLAITHKKWHTYVLNEILSVALQGLMHGMLASCLADTDNSLSKSKTINGLIDGFIQCEIGRDTLRFLKKNTFAELVQYAQSTLPSISEWQNDKHELKCVIDIENISKEDNKKEELIKITRKSAWVLVCLAYRLSSIEDPYEHFEFPKGYYDYYPINLSSFKQNAENIWMKQTTEKWFVWVLKKWIVEGHISVALRKLRYQSESTFKIRPEEDEYEIVETVLPGFTNPRFVQTRQVLIDLGIFKVSSDGYIQLTELGNSLI